MTVYHLTPKNYSEIQSYIDSDITHGLEIINNPNFNVFFYDACSFRRHSNLKVEYRDIIVDRIIKQNGIIIILRTILMELGQKSGILENNYIEHFKYLHNKGIKIFILNEEDIYNSQIDAVTQTKINEDLVWAYRSLEAGKSAKEYLKGTAVLKEVNREKTPTREKFIDDFFTILRNFKTEDDDLGEQMISFCLYILSARLPIIDYRYAIISDDFGALYLISNVVRKNRAQFKSQICLLSTLKIIVKQYDLNVIKNSDSLREILSDYYHNEDIPFYGCIGHETKIVHNKMSINDFVNDICNERHITLLF